jgi:hypothetical protein
MYDSSIWVFFRALSSKLHSVNQYAVKTLNIYLKRCMMICMIRQIRKVEIECHMFLTEQIGTNYMLFLSSEIGLVDTQDSYAPGYVLVMLQKWHTSSNLLSLYFCQKNVCC